MKKQRPLPESEEGKKIIRKYLRALVLLFFSLNVNAQSEIVIGSGSLGTGNFVIGGNIIDTEMLYDNKYTKTKTPVIPKPKTRGKYKKSEKQRLKEEAARILKESLKIKK